MSNFFQGFSLYQGRIQSLNELAYVRTLPLPKEKRFFFVGGRVRLHVLSPIHHYHFNPWLNSSLTPNRFPI